MIVLQPHGRSTHAARSACLKARDLRRGSAVGQTHKQGDGRKVRRGRRRLELRAVRPRQERAGSSVASRLPAMTPEKAKAAKRKFECGVIARGEAVPAGKPLPPGATHEIVGNDAEGAPILKRKRFSLK